MGQGKALTGMAVSALSLEVCKQGLKGSGREHALTAPGQEAGQMTAQYCSALRVLVQKQRSSCKFWQTENTRRKGGLPVIRRHLRHSLERSTEVA